MNLDVHVKQINGTQMAAKIKGTFTISRTTLDFTAIAFGRIGGQNVGVKLSDVVQEELKKLNLDPEDIAMQLQKNLLQGDLTIPDNVTKEEFIDD
ncbi:MAG: hypothetical protein K8823_1147 [Cenarchaeum symbiont of Oopsacas minuta]|nr:hypothetical protein [Cenarchaeum symbiont of Oopsacas minuta]